MTAIKIICLIYGVIWMAVFYYSITIYKKRYRSMSFLEWARYDIVDFSIHMGLHLTWSFIWPAYIPEALKDMKEDKKK